MTKYTLKPTAKNAPGAPLKAIKNLGVRRPSKGFCRKLVFSTTPEKRSQPSTPEKRPQPMISSLDEMRLQKRKIAKAKARAKRSLF